MEENKFGLPFHRNNQEQKCKREVIIKRSKIRKKGGGERKQL